MIRSLFRLFCRGAATAVVLLLGAGCAGSVSEPAERGADRELRLVDATQEAGLSEYRHVNGGFGKKWMPEIVGPGAAFLDYDSDGRLDVVIVGGGGWEQTAEESMALWLYRNLGDGTFDLVSEEAGVASLQTYPFGVATADYDNDGDTDLFVTTLHENLLLRNDGGRYVDVSSQSGVADQALWSTSALFIDGDGDGWLDLYVANYVAWSPETDIFCGNDGRKGYCTPQLYDGVASSYYENNGDGTFTNRTEKAGFLAGIEPEKDKSLGVAQLDYNNDGAPDIFVANDTERDLLYENNGDGTFTERGVKSGVAFDQHGKARAGMGVDAGVVDSSGHVSIFVGNFTQEMVGVYRHTASDFFMDRATMSRVGFSSLNTLTFGLFLADLDLDTDLDLFLANGHVQEHISELVEGVTFRQPSQIFLNDGGGSFTEVETWDGVLTKPLVGRGAANGDYDGDGDLDVLVVENDGPVHLWRNDTPIGRFLRVSLEGTRSNRDGLGARIVTVAGGLRMERLMRSGSSYLSESERVATFGLGSHATVDSLIVRWPSGVVDRFGPVEGNQHVRIVEGSDRLEPVRDIAAAVP